MIKRILNSSNIQNGMWLYLLQFFNAVIPFITIPYVTRVLGQAGYGTFSVALNIITYLQVLIEYGFEMSATREVAVSSKENNALCRIFTCVIYARFILFGISVLIAVAYLVVTKASLVLWVSLLVMLACLIGYCVQQNWLFQGMMDMKYISIVVIVARTVSTILVFIFVKTENDIVTYSLLYSVSPLLGGFLGYLVAKKNYSLHLVRVSFADVIGELKKGWYVFTTQLSSIVFGSIGVTFLGIFSTDEVVGTFSAIQKIPNVMMLAWMPVSRVLYPIVSRQMKDSFEQGRNYVRKYRRIILPVFALGALLIGIFSRSVVRIVFGSEYAVYSYWTIPLLVWFVLAVNNNFLGIQTLLASGHDREYSICFQFSVVCTILINLVLVYCFAGNGAALAPMISEAILLAALLLQSRKIHDTINNI